MIDRCYIYNMLCLEILVGILDVLKVHGYRAHNPAYLYPRRTLCLGTKLVSFQEKLLH